jgi:hypothetical protein
LELVDHDGWEYVHRFATLGVVVVVAVDHGTLLLVEDRCRPTSTHDEHGKSQRSHFTRRRRCVPAADLRQAAPGWREDVRVR